MRSEPGTRSARGDQSAEAEGEASKHTGARAPTVPAAQCLPLCACEAYDWGASFHGAAVYVRPHSMRARYSAECSQEEVVAEGGENRPIDIVICSMLGTMGVKLSANGRLAPGLCTHLRACARRSARHRLRPPACHLLTSCARGVALVALAAIAAPVPLSATAATATTAAGAALFFALALALAVARALRILAFAVVQLVLAAGAHAQLYESILADAVLQRSARLDRDHRCVAIETTGVWRRVLPNRAGDAPPRRQS